MKTNGKDALRSSADDRLRPLDWRAEKAPRGGARPATVPLRDDELTIAAANYLAAQLAADSPGERVRIDQRYGELRAGLSAGRGAAGDALGVRGAFADGTH